MPHETNEYEDRFFFSSHALFYIEIKLCVYIYMIDLKFQFTPLPILIEREKNVKQMDQLGED